MTDALVITPVKDSPETTRMTLEAIAKAEGNFRTIVFDDFSEQETREYLLSHQQKLGYELISLKEHTDNPSPNYKLVLQMAQQMALSLGVPMILIESDVVINSHTIAGLLTLAGNVKNPGMIGVITVDHQGNYNFPYGNVKKEGKAWSETNRSLSFCCTLITPEFLRKYDFSELSAKKDWFDIHISRQSKKLGFKNYLIREQGVLHLPHSSRPWKQLKYSNPLKYYFHKLFSHRDRI